MPIAELTMDDYLERSADLDHDAGEINELDYINKTIHIGTRSYEIGKALGEGGCAKVFNGRLSKNGIYDKAVKIGRVTNVYVDMINELEILRGFSNQNVIHVHDWRLIGNICYLTMDKAMSSLVNIAYGPLKVEEVGLIITDMTTCLEALQQQGIVHRDVKPENFLIMTDGNIKICDFGIAKRVEKNKVATLVFDGNGTLPYMAPESFTSLDIVVSTYKIGFATDVWAIGIIVFYMIFSSFPFATDSQEEMEDGVLRGRYSYEGDCDVELTPFLPVLKSMLNGDPNTRPSATTILQDKTLEQLRHNYRRDGIITKVAAYQQ